jgi:hypothetical protein
MSKSTWGVIVSAAFTAASSVIPIPEGYRHYVVITSVTLLVSACIGWLWAHKKERFSASNDEGQPKVELELKGGLIGARVTNNNESEVRVEDIWIYSMDVTGATTVAKKIPKQAYVRAKGMPHQMAPHSSFEVVFRYSEGAFQSYGQSHPAQTPEQYWIEVKLEDGRVISSDHRQIVIAGQDRPLERDQQRVSIAHARDMLANYGKAVASCVHPIQALLEVRAFDLDTNDDLVRFCADINKFHPHPFQNWPTRQEDWLAVLWNLRFRGITIKTPADEYEAMKALYLDAPPERFPHEQVSTSDCLRLQITALPANPNTRNKTQLGWTIRGRPAFDADCLFSVHNPNLKQAVDGVAFRLLGSDPPLLSARGFDPLTNDADLRRLPLTLDTGEILKGDQTGQVRVFRATRHPMAEKHLKNIRIEFGEKPTGKPIDQFVPQAYDHMLIVEAVATGLPRTEAQFQIHFSVNADESVFVLTKLPV